MATQQVILIVGLLHLMNVKPAPLTNTRIDSFQAPVLDSRFNLDDKRQNWGLLINGSIYAENENVNYNRPITIPRTINSNPNLSGEKIATKPRPDALTNVKVPFKAKRFMEKKYEANDQLKVSYNEPRKTLQCDVARIKCCVNELDLNNCPIGSECLNMENNFNLCDPKVLQEGIKRVMSLF